MIKFDHPEFEDVSFTVKEHPKNRDILTYDGEIEGFTRTVMYPRLWAGVKWLVDEWKIEGINPDDDIEAIMNGDADMRTIKIMKWAGLACFSFRQSLEPEKN
jgi:hypothetical protein